MIGSRNPVVIAAALLTALSLEMTMMTAYAQTKAPTSSASSGVSALPNGATSLNETYQDWAVLCQADEKGRACVMTQQQRKQDTNQLVLAVELNKLAKDEIRGNLVLPFGLRLADGVAIQVDDGPAEKLAFVTCLPAGCIVPLVFDTTMIKAVRSGTAIKVVAKAYDSGQSVQLAISLKGFAAAQDRVLALAAK